MLQYLDLEPLFDESPILVTPHRCTPEESIRDIKTLETIYLKRGIFNFGFLGLRRDNDLLGWWIKRLKYFCINGSESEKKQLTGLFVDQKWGNFIPIYCRSYKVLDQLTYGINVSSWSVTDFDKISPDRIRTYHFSFGPHEQKNQIWYLKTARGLKFERDVEFLLSLCDEYVEKLVKRGYQIPQHEPYYKIDVESVREAEAAKKAKKKRR